MGVWRYSHGQNSSLCLWLVIEEVRKQREEKIETKLIWCKFAALSCPRPLRAMAATLAWSSFEKADNKQESWFHQQPWCGQMYISIFVLRSVATTATKSQPFSPYRKFWHLHLHSGRGCTVTFWVTICRPAETSVGTWERMASYQCRLYNPAGPGRAMHAQTCFAAGGITNPKYIA